MTRAPQWSSIDLAEAKINALQPSDKPSLALLEPFSAVAEDPFVNDLYPLWTWVSGGGCLVDSASPLKWFSRPTGGYLFLYTFYCFTQYMDPYV